MRKPEDILETECFDWKDMVIFLMDEKLKEFLEEMHEDGDIELLDEEELYEVADYIEKQMWKALGR